MSQITSESSELKYLLEHTDKLINEQTKKAVDNFEDFNVFSILGLERNENRTHSNFLAYLLNPKSNHKKGSKFLDYFLRRVDLDLFDIDSVKISIEKHIGFINRDDKTGGRIDLYLEDKNKNVLVIENKLFAKDQEQQIERYYNFCKENVKESSSCEVLYLNLWGAQPNKDSIGKLMQSRDFRVISYKYDIVPWLIDCENIASDNPVLLHTIRQYKFLICKLTNTMLYNDDLINVMFTHFDASRYIRDNFNAMQGDVCEEIRDKLIAKLNKDVGNDFDIVKGRPIHDPYAQIEIFYKGQNDRSLYFGIDSLSYNYPHEEIDYGLYNLNESSTNYRLNQEPHSEDPHWPYYKNFSSYGDISIRFNKPEIYIAWHNNEDNFREGLIEHLSKEVTDFIELHNEALKEFFSKEKGVEILDEATFVSKK